MASGEAPAVGLLRRRYESILSTQTISYPVPFHLSRELGRGRQGRVFLGLRQGARGCVTEHAIKVFDPGLYRDPKEYWTDMGRIASQVSRMQRVQSPHLVQRHSYEETNGIGYVQMEAVSGLDLRRLLSRDHLETARSRCSAEEWEYFQQTVFRDDGTTLSIQPGVVVYILRSVLRALEALHDLGFLHADVKPGNIMIDRLGTVKVIDFGRAVYTGENLSFLLGSPMYMPPETHLRKPGTAESDFYSLGLVAIEMLRGERLVPKETSEEELLRAKRELPGRLTEILPPDVVENSELLGILRRFVGPDPAARYASAMEAEVGDEGLNIVDRQLVRAGLSSEYARDLSGYLSLLTDPQSGLMDVPAFDDVPTGL